MHRLKEEIKRQEQITANLQDKLEEAKAKLSIKCQSCLKYHRIKDLVVIQTHWFIPPSGCTEGAYWKQGELHFICPNNKVRNRILFNNSDVEWDKREELKHNPANQFHITYKYLFKEVLKEFEDHIGSSVNNYYIDENRKKFDLVEKKENKECG